MRLSDRRELENLSPMEAQARIVELRKMLADLNRAYYDLDSPLVEDFVYDGLSHELTWLEQAWPEFASQESPSRKVGGSADSRFVKVAHRVPMLSLDDVFEYAEVEAFVKSIQDHHEGAEFIVEEKIDGLSLGLRYEDGRLILAHTRGDGRQFGEDVTDNVRQLSGLPLELPDGPEYLEIRGEVYFPLDRFIQLNLQREELGEEAFKNPRNAAAGTMRQLNPDLVRARGLRFFAFNIQDQRGLDLVSHSQGLEYLSKLGFEVSPNWARAVNYTQVESEIKAIEARRKHLNYGLDGAVVKVDDLKLRSELGQTAKAPRWALAFKYQPEVKETKLLEIRTQVGRTGRVTPMAVFEPVELAGTTVQRATLNNADYIKLLDLRLGDTIRVMKSGEIIPTVLSVNLDFRSESAQVFEMPKACPVCGSCLQQKGADLFCLNPSCPAKNARQFEYFASKNAMDIAGMGPSTVRILLERFGLSSVADLYSLKERRDELVESGLIGREKRVDNLLQAIEDSKKQSFSRLLTALGIPGVGQETAALIVKHLHSMDGLIKASIGELEAIPGLGPILADNVYEFFHNEQQVDLLRKLGELGLSLVQEENQLESATDNPRVRDKSFVITGSFADYTRTELKRRIEGNGGKVASQVSSKTNYLVVGEKPGSKLDRARELEIQELGLDDLLRLLGE